MSIFIDRVVELAVLNERYARKGAEFIILYGRRRVGKSELIEHFLKTRRGIRFLAREESKHLQLKKISRNCAEFFHDTFLQQSPFGDWDSFFSYLAGKTKERIVIAIDEFPYLVKEDPSLPSIIQEYWDTRLKDSGIVLILSGSSISMMEEYTMQHSSPLYGRRTGQILLHGFRFVDVLDYMGDFVQAVEYYSVFGGTPAYLMAIDKEKGVFENITKKILSADAGLFKDVEFVLRMELNEPRYYFSILYSIAKGNNRIGLIMNDTGLDKGLITKYLSILIDLQLVRRKIPITDNRLSRKGLYQLSDNLFTFWFRFVHPNIERIERGEGDLVIQTDIQPQFSQYIGKLFESMAEDLFLEFNREGLLPFRFDMIGSWWDKGEEIDLVAYQKEGPSILFCECKWQDQVNGEKLLAQLKEKSAGVPWMGKTRKEYYCIIARSFSPPQKKQENDENTLYLDTGDLASWHQKCHQKHQNKP
ncbi:MAG: ATP-binding protein [Methanomicrobiales archaeon]|nr:ATP-binding protein [Methanomicrobiales archaeon]